jgi:hypothetical protein
MRAGKYMAIPLKPGRKIFQSFMPALVFPTKTADPGNCLNRIKKPSIEWGMLNPCVAEKKPIRVFPVK